MCSSSCQGVCGAAGGLDAAPLHGEAVHGLVETQVRALHAQQVQDVLAERIGSGHPHSCTALRYDQTACPRLPENYHLERILDSGDRSLFDVPSKAPGPQGALPVTPEMLLQRPSGDLFGWTQNAGMGWDPALLGGKEFLILSTHGGIRAADGTPVALGYHTGHWEVGAAHGGRRQGT